MAGGGRTDEDRSRLPVYFLSQVLTERPVCIFMHIESTYPNRQMIKGELLFSRTISSNNIDGSLGYHMAIGFKGQQNMNTC